MNVDMKNPSVQRALLAFLAAGSLAGLYFFSQLLPFSYPNQRTRIQSMKDEYEKKATELARARATVSDLPRFEAEYERLHTQWAQAAELVPTERQLPTLLRRITLQAQQNGVGLASVKPGGIEARDHYSAMPIQLSVSGGYHEIGAFLADLANMSRIVTVTGLQLKAAAAGEEGSRVTTTAEFTASAYHLSSGAAPAPVPAARKEEPNDHKDS